MDELFLTATELPPELLSGFPEWEPPMQILTALTYLVDVDAALCPTVVVPCAPPSRPPDVDLAQSEGCERCGSRGSHRAMRSPRPDERSWEGNGAPRTVLANAGDTLLFRSVSQPQPQHEIAT